MTMKRLAAALLVLALAWLSAGCFGGQDNANRPAANFTGYLIDQRCGMGGDNAGNAENVLAHPEKHTLACARMPDCIVSGYGIAARQADGNYRFYSFDADGSILALNTIIYVSKKADNIAIDVNGTLENGMIAVKSIKEK